MPHVTEDQELEIRNDPHGDYTTQMGQHQKWQQLGNLCYYVCEYDKQQIMDLRQSWGMVGAQFEQAKLEHGQGHYFDNP